MGAANIHKFSKNFVRKNLRIAGLVYAVGKNITITIVELSFLDENISFATEQQKLSHKN